MMKMSNVVMSSPITSVSVLLRTRVISPVQLIQTSMRIIDSSRELNAFISVISQEDAVNQARESMERIQTNEARSKLEGIPIGIKDNFTSTAFKTTCGSKMLENYHPSSFDCTVINKLVNECGAILIGKTNLDEFAMGSGTTDSHFGPTINPWKSGFPFQATSFKSNDRGTTDSLTILDISGNQGIKNGIAGKNGTSGKDGMENISSNPDCGYRKGSASGLNDHLHRGYDRNPRISSSGANPTKFNGGSNVENSSQNNLDTFVISGHGSQSGPVQLDESSFSSSASSFSSCFKKEASSYETNILNGPACGSSTINHPTNDHHQQSNHDGDQSDYVSAHVAISDEEATTREMGTTSQSMSGGRSNTQTIISGLINNQAKDMNKNELIENWFIAGGSSGGSAVAVATGSVMAAIGSDTGGSTRHPAAQVGVVGFKPTYGLISRHGLVPLTHSMDTVGIMTKYASDAALLLECLAGHDDKDSTCLVNGVEKLSRNGKFDSRIQLKGLRIGLPVEYEQELVSSVRDGSREGEEILNVWTKTAKLLEEKGAIVKRISLPHSKYVGATYLILNSAEVASNFSCYDGIEFGYRANEPLDEEGRQLVKYRTAGKLFEATRRVFGSNVKSRILAGNYFLLTPNQGNYLNHAMKVRRLIYQEFQNVFCVQQTMKNELEEEKEDNYIRVNCGNNHVDIRDTHDCVNTDHHGSNISAGKGSNYSVKYDTNYDVRKDLVSDVGSNDLVDFILTPAALKPAVTIKEWKKRSDNQQQAMKEDFFTVGANLAGLPAVTFPVTLSKDGLPLSLQLIANHFMDYKLLSVAQQIQNLVDFPFLTYQDDECNGQSGMK